MGPIERHVALSDPRNVNERVPVDESVTNEKIAASAIDGSQIMGGQIVGGHIANNTIGGAKIVNSAINANHIQGEQIVAGHIANNTIGGAKIVANAITGAHIAGNQIVAGHILDGTINHPKLSVNAVDTQNIRDNSVTGAKLTQNYAIQGHNHNYAGINHGHGNDYAGNPHGNAQHSSTYSVVGHTHSQSIKLMSKQKRKAAVKLRNKLRERRGEDELVDAVLVLMALVFDDPDTLLDDMQDTPQAEQRKRIERQQGGEEPVGQEGGIKHPDLEAILG